MFSTSSLYFLVAIFSESIESSEAHGLPQKPRNSGVKMKTEK
jgi:hypothetical protein